MKFFLDTADVNEIKQVAQMGLLDGVTTNPTLIARSGRKFEDAIREICEICQGPVSAECVTEKFDEMLPEARKLAKLGSNVVVKVPLTTKSFASVQSSPLEVSRLIVRSATVESASSFATFAPSVTVTTAVVSPAGLLPTSQLSAVDQTELIAPSQM